MASQFYSLKEDEELKEMTEVILEHTHTKEAIKDLIRTTGRRFFLFRYPSDGFLVKGYISFIPNTDTSPLLVFLRGGNRIFGLMHPANAFSCMKNYTLISTTYRGGVSEGTDQYGGDEVNDVHNLLSYFPTLAKQLSIFPEPQKIFMLGGSRGGMEMFLALGRSPLLQEKITKAVSLSGLLDMREHLLYRNELKEMFIRDFGLIPGENDEEWIDKRNPINVVPHLRKELPFLILQGTQDYRVHPKESHHMIKMLKENGNEVDYVEILEGTHDLMTHPNLIEFISDWLEK